jgi:hypothetical protein
MNKFIIITSRLYYTDTKIIYFKYYIFQILYLSLEIF